jgi:hypothetical protein
VHTLALGIGLALVVIGLVAYVGSGTASVTALVPSFLGVILAALGGFAMARPAARRHAMHAAAAVALLGFLGSLQGLPAFVALLGGAVVERPWAAVAQTITAVLSAVFVAAAVSSFVRARRERVKPPAA